MKQGKIREVVSRYLMRINPHYRSLIKTKGDGLYEQAIHEPRGSKISLLPGYILRDNPDAMPVEDYMGSRTRYPLYSLQK